MFGFVFLPGLARAADQNICKQSWVAQAQLCYRKCLFPAKTEVTASRRFNSLHVLSTRSLVQTEQNIVIQLKICSLSIRQQNNKISINVLIKQTKENQKFCLKI